MDDSTGKLDRQSANEYLTQESGLGIEAPAGPFDSGQIDGRFRCRNSGGHLASNDRSGLVE